MTTPHIIFMVVVFPAPFGPRKPNIWPRGIDRLRSTTALTGAEPRRRKVFDKDSSSIAFIGSEDILGRGRGLEDFS